MGKRKRVKGVAETENKIPTTTQPAISTDAVSVDVEFCSSALFPILCLHPLLSFPVF